MKILCIIMFLLGLLLGAGCMLILGIRGMNKHRKAYRKLKTFYHLLVNWVDLKIYAQYMYKYFENCHYKKIAIYGKKELGTLLYDELRESTISVECFIDRDADYILSDIPIITPEKIGDFQVDAIIVTAVTEYDIIFTNLRKFTSIPIVSLKSIINSMVREFRNS